MPKNKLPMSRNLYIGVFLFVVSMAIGTMGGCTSSAPSSSQQSKDLLIVATTGMIADAAQVIVGEVAQVEGLMGAGVDPHLYKATRSDLTKLREADIILYNGLHLEGKMGEVLEKLGESKPVYAVAEAISKDRLMQTQAGSYAYDPHIWFDVRLWKDVCLGIGNELGKQFPQHREGFLERSQAYADSLDTLHTWTQQQIATIPENSRVLITAHDAFEYFGRAYDIEVKGLQGISTVAEFGLRDIRNLVDLIVDRNIQAVFVESSVPRKSLEAVVEGCQRQGHAVSIGGTLYSDAMGAVGTPEGTYPGMVRSNVQTIVDGLKPEV